MALSQVGGFLSAGFDDDLLLLQTDEPQPTVSRTQNQFQWHTIVTVRRAGCHECKPHRLPPSQSLASVIESLITEATITAKGTNRMPALLLLPEKLGG